MRYIGSKEGILNFIEETAEEENITAENFDSICDIFAGTCAVSKLFKKKGFKVITNDIQHYSYVFGKSYIQNNEYPTFDNLKNELDGINDYNYQVTLQDKNEDIRPMLKVLSFLNSIDGEKGFIYSNYTPEGTKEEEYQRKYFSNSNGKKIDAIRIQLREWREQDLITENEFHILLTSLLDAVTKVSNTTGTYGAFLKDWDPRAKKEIKMKPIEVIDSKEEHECYNGDANEVIEKVESDVLYIDPPYNGRQYISNYHILETISLYDSPGIRGKTGLRNDPDKKSDYCYQKRAYDSLNDLISKADSDVIVLSYSNEGILDREEIAEIMSKHGELSIYGKGHRRYRSDDFEERNFDNEEDEVEEYLFVSKK